MRATLHSAPILSAVAALGALSGCSGGHTESPATADRSAVVRAAPVTDTVLARPIMATGTVAPADQAALGFKIGGVIQRIAVDAGDRVRAGQVLASLDLREIDAALARARSGAAKTARDVERARRLHADSVVSRAQFQDAETANDIAQADLRAAAVNRGYAVIVAPVDGRVLRRDAEPGENIAAGATVLVVGSAGGQRGQVIELGLADRDAVSVREGDPATAQFDAFPGRVFSGRVTRIGAAADPGTGTYLVEVALGAADGLSAGLVGRVEIRPSRGSPATLVPIAALLDADGDAATMYVLSPDGRRAERRRVSVAFIAGDRVAVTGGLEGATRVLTDGAAYLDDGAAVRVTP